ncbi:MAG: hypothetical protein EXS27_08155 [Pedosphaera sp.]|nr:hypothetical protein [Pedosphaera sp.]
MNQGRTVFAQLLDLLLYHSSFRQPIARSTLADANEKLDRRIFADSAQVLIEQATALYAGDPWGVLKRQLPFPSTTTKIP